MKLTRGIEIHGKNCRLFVIDEGLMVTIASNGLIANESAYPTAFFLLCVVHISEIPYSKKKRFFGLRKCDTAMF